MKIKKRFLILNRIKKSLINYDVWEHDLTPAEWIAICKKSEGPHARSPIYENKKY
jgi:hypothetical protein